MPLLDEVRASCAEIAPSARSVQIDVERLGDVRPGPPPVLDPQAHYLEGPRDEVVSYLVTLDAINFGSGWFPTLRKRAGCSGYFTVAAALADHFRQHGPWSAAELGELDASELGAVLGQEPTTSSWPSTRGRCATWAPSWASARRRSSSTAAAAPPSGWRSRWPRACRSSTIAASTSAPRSPRTTWRSPAWPRSTTSTGSPSSPTTSCRTCCGWTAC